MPATTKRYRSRALALLIVAIAHALFIAVLVTGLRVQRPAQREPLFMASIVRASRPQPPAAIPIAAPPELAPRDLLLTPVPVEILPETPAVRPLPAEPAPAPSAAPPESSGQGAALPFTQLAVLHAVRPVYPPASIRAREQGMVVVAVLVNARGQASELRILQSSGYRKLDESAVAAIGKWQFAMPADRAYGSPAWARVSWQFVVSPPELSDMALSVLPFDARMAARFQEGAASATGPQIPAPRGARALRRLIDALRDFELRQTMQPARAQAPRLPIELLGSWGPMTSVQFLGFGSQGLDAPFEQDADTQSAAAALPTSWERYELRQQGGVSEWLLSVYRSGAIQSAQAMLCTRSCAGP